jgi:hypothetical protein
LVVMASHHSWSAIPKVSQPKGWQANGLFRVFQILILIHKS